MGKESINKLKKTGPCDISDSDTGDDEMKRGWRQRAVMMSGEKKEKETYMLKHVINFSGMEINKVFLTMRMLRTAYLTRQMNTKTLKRQMSMET